MKIYHFPIIINGSGENADEAWRDACESFEQDWGETPEEYEVEEETE